MGSGSCTFQTALPASVDHALVDDPSEKPNWKPPTEESSAPVPAAVAAEASGAALNENENPESAGRAKRRETDDRQIHICHKIVIPTTRWSREAERGRIARQGTGRRGTETELWCNIVGRRAECKLRNTRASVSARRDAATARIGLLAGGALGGIGLQRAQTRTNGRGSATGIEHTANLVRDHAHRALPRATARQELGQDAWLRPCLCVFLGVFGVSDIYACLFGFSNH